MSRRIWPTVESEQIIMWSSSIQLRQYFSRAGKALAVILFCVFLPKFATGETIFQDFEDSSSLSANFTQSSNSTGSFAWSATDGINNSGKVAITASTDVIYTTKQKILD